MIQIPLTVLAVLLATLSPSFALRQQVLSSFVFTRYGDRTPLYTPDSSVLTPYGARQMYNAGSNFRSRYLTTTFDSASITAAIRDISHYQLDSDEVSIFADNNQYSVASAQAFMQGLYPPLGDATNLNYTQIPGISNLANSTNIVSPLNGYQYPAIETASSYDINSIWINGAADCPAWATALVEYYNTSNFDFLYKSSLDFYQALGNNILSNNFAPNNLGMLQLTIRGHPVVHFSLSHSAMHKQVVHHASWYLMLIS